MALWPSPPGGIDLRPFVRFPSRSLRLYRRWFRLEPLFAIGSISFVVGLAIEVLLLANWTLGGPGGHLPLAALAQTLLIVGAELGMTGFLVMAVATPAASGEL